jgi:DNA polymerase
VRALSIDIETYSTIDLAKSGVYRYTESPDFAILLFGYSVDGGEVQVVDLTCGETIPPEVVDALMDEDVTKWAFNAQFERICLSKWLGLPPGQYLDPKSWRCTMVWSAYMGLPLSLEGTGAVLGLEKQKLTEGKDLIRYFCQPCKPTAANGGRTRNLPEHALDKWERFKAYNRRDVESEMAIQEKLAKFPVPEEVWEEYQLDQRINDRGVALDMDFVRQAIRFDEHSRSLLMRLMQELTELENPNSVMQMKNWLSSQGLETDTLGKKAVDALLKEAPPELKEVLRLRQQLAKSSVRKYTAMENVVCGDGRARGMFQFYGANRTGRWAGRLIQLHNLVQTHISDLAEARSLVRCGNLAALEMLYPSIPEVLSELIRTAFVPKAGCKFIVADFAAIEARVIAWLAGERWRQEVFESGGDIYCASASQMFHVPVEKNGVNGHLRQKGKIAELALGYGGSVGALKAMGALEMGLEEEELQPLVSAWKSSNPNIVKLWWDVDRAAKTAVKDRSSTETHGIRFSCQSGMLFITLPSDRRLSYVKPRIGENRFGSDCITYEGIGSTKKWERIESYGPKLVENIVQAISRDLLSHAMRRLDAMGYNIVMHVHDEVVIEAPVDVSVDDICAVMSQPPPWAKGLLLRADGYETDFYKKD